MAGGSRIVISDDGITISTGGKILYQAGQHKFEGGNKVNFTLPELPNIQYAYSNKVDVFNLFKDSELTNVRYSVLHKNGLVKKGVLDQYGRTDRLRSHEQEQVKALIGGDEWHYYIDSLGGAKEDETIIKFLDFIGDPIPKLTFQLSNENNKVIFTGTTDKNGFAVFKCSEVDFPLLSVRSIFDGEFKPIIRIENNYVRQITFISPKILKEITLFQDSDEQGDYKRSNYSE